MSPIDPCGGMRRARMPAPGRIGAADHLVKSCSEQTRRKAVTQSHGATVIVSITTLAGPPAKPDL